MSALSALTLYVDIDITKFHKGIHLTVSIQVEWYVFKCQQYAVSCGATGDFDQITIRNPLYKLTQGSSYLAAEKLDNSTLITPLEFPGRHGEYAEAIAKWSSSESIKITSGQAQ